MNAAKNAGNPKSIRKRKKRNVVKLVTVTRRGEAVTRGDPLVRVTLLEDAGLQPLPLVEEVAVTLCPRVNNRGLGFLDHRDNW